MVERKTVAKRMPRTLKAIRQEMKARNKRGLNSQTKCNTGISRSCDGQEI